MAKKLLCTAVFFAASLGVPATGQASIFELHFNAVVTHVGDLTGTLDALVHAGDPVSIDIGYDPATPEFPGYVGDPTQGAYLSTGWIHITINDLLFAMDGLQVDVVNRPDQDLVSFNAGTLYAHTAISEWPATLPMFPIRGGGVGFIGLLAPFNLVSSDALPAKELSWRRATLASGHVGAGTEELSRYDISFQVEVVPEPATITLAGVGITWAIVRRRRR